MNTTQNILTLPLPNVIDEVNDVVRCYRSRLLTPEQAASATPVIKHLVLACGPWSRSDAETMLATASRFLADVATTDAVDVDALLTDFEVARWLHAKVREGMPPQTVSNHRQRLARFLRVRRGLPARMALPSAASHPDAPLDDEARVALQAALAGTDPHVLAAYVAAVGSGAIGAAGVGAAVAVIDDRYWVVLGDQRWEVVSELWPFAGGVAGVTIGSDSWGALKALATDLGITFDRATARATFSVLALSEVGSPAALIRRFGLTRRAIDMACAFLPAVDPRVTAGLLRG